MDFNRETVIVQTTVFSTFIHEWQANIIRNDHYL